MTVRGMHFVGSYPARNAKDAMSAMLQGTDWRIDRVPDGETGEHAGDCVQQARHARAVLDELAGGREPALTLQIGIPHLASEHVDRRIHDILPAVGADQVLFQIESGCVLRQYLSGRKGRSTASADSATGEGLARAINRSTPQARFGVHLCLGAGGRRAFIPQARRVRAIVSAVDSIAGALHRPESVEYVHFPVVHGTIPPQQSAVYRPLAVLREILPPDARIIAGLVDEHQPLRDLLRVRDVVEDVIGEPVDIAASSGLGQRTPETAQLIMTRMMELASE